MNTNVNSETGIRYGVIIGHVVPLLIDEIMSNGEDLGYLAFKDEKINAIYDALKSLDSDDDEKALRKMAEETFDAMNWDNAYISDESPFEYTDDKGNKFQLQYLGGAPHVWCIKTSKITKARLCSPCIPNGGDLDSIDIENGYECYGVPDEYFEDGHDKHPDAQG